MKKVIVILVMACMPLVASAINIDITAVDQDGCEWKIQGDIDFSIFGGVSGYNVTAKDCHGNEYHFESQGIANGGGNNGGNSNRFEDYNHRVRVIRGDAPRQEGVRFIFTVVQRYSSQR